MDTLNADWESLLRFAPRLFYGLIVFVIFLTVGRLLGRLVERVLQRSDSLRTNMGFLRRLTTWSVALIGIMLSLSIMGFKGVAASMLATGGVMAVVLGFAFREIGENFLAGFFLTFSRPFEIGDLVKTGDLTGTVKSIELRFVHIRTFDACDVFVPSAKIFRESLYNYTRDGLRRPKFSVGVAYSDEPNEVIKLLDTATRKVSEVLAFPQPFVTVSEFGSQYIEYEVFFWMDVNKAGRGLVATTNDVKIACWKALRDAGMTFSTDVTTGLEIKTMPPIDIDVSGSKTEN